MEELKQCPFCGSDSVDIYKHDNGNKCIVCYKCFASSGNYMTEQMAVDAWNRREVVSKMEIPTGSEVE